MPPIVVDFALAFTLLSLTWAVGYAFFRVCERGGFVNSLLLTDSRVFVLAYRLLKVEWFRWLLINTPLRYTSEKIRLHNHGTAELLRVRREMVDSEVSHHFGFWLCALASLLYVFHGGRVSLFVPLSICNAFGNFYPVLVQIRNRSQLDKALERRATRASVHPHIGGAGYLQSEIGG